MLGCRHRFNLQIEGNYLQFIKQKFSLGIGMLMLVVISQIYGHCVIKIYGFLVRYEQSSVCKHTTLSLTIFPLLLFLPFQAKNIKNRLHISNSNVTKVAFGKMVKSFQ